MKPAGASGRLAVGRGLAAALGFFLAIPVPLHPESEPVTLAPDRAVERQLAGREVHGFAAELAAGHWLVRAEQLGIDVVLEASDADGRSLALVDSPLDGQGTVSLVISAPVAGGYRLEVRPRDPAVTPGRYRLTLTWLDDATDRGPR